MSDRPELLPCPFCGMPAQIEELGDHHGEYFNLGCSDHDCPAHHMFYTVSDAPKELAIATWNRRTSCDRPDAIRAALRERAEPGEAVQPVAWRQRIGDKWAYFDGPQDPREIHDNGKPCEPLYTAPPSRAAIVEECARVCDQFIHADKAAAAIRSLAPASGKVLIDREPSDGLLMSMAIRYDHALGCPGYYDQPMFAAQGVTHAQRLESTLRTMRQLYEEISGRGFYSSEREDDYKAMLAAASGEKE